jgi:uncharacterized delta-60 repeat protein
MMFLRIKQRILFFSVCVLFLLVMAPSAAFSAVTIDPSFTSAYVTDGSVNNLVIQPDGKIIVGTQYGSSLLVNHLVRLNIDGTLDTDFVTNLGSGFESGISDNSIILQPDGKIVLGYDVGAGLNGNYLLSGTLRLNSNGTVDNTFNPQISGTSYGHALQSDGKIIAVGSFTVSTYTNYVLILMVLLMRLLLIQTYQDLSMP